MRFLAAGTKREIFYPEAKWRYSYLVTDKYIPRKDRSSFLVFLQDKEGHQCHALVDTSLYNDFDVADVIRFGRRNPQKPNIDGWLTIQGDFNVLRAQPTIEHLSIEIGYISKPVRVGGGVCFVTAIGSQKWLKIPYDVAKNYFEKGQVIGGSGTDYYQVLGVDRSAELDQIRKAYRMLARKYHSDAGTNPDKDIMQRVNEAHDILSDGESRAEYDVMIGGKCHGNPLVAWPGSGAGALEILGEDRGSLINALQVLSFTRKQRIERMVFRSDPGTSEPFFALRDRHTLQFVWCGDDITDSSDRNRHTKASSFDVSGEWYSNLPSEIEVEVEYRKRAHWNSSQGKIWYTWDVRDLRILNCERSIIDAD